MLYEINENTLIYFTKGVCYKGFMQNSEEKQLEAGSIALAGEMLEVGDKIVGFRGNKDRDTFMLAYDYMIYKGRIGPELLFEVYDHKESKIQSLFQERPMWLLSFIRISEDSLQMMSSKSTSWDITVNQIVRYNKLKAFKT